MLRKCLNFVYYLNLNKKIVLIIFEEKLKIFENFKCLQITWKNIEYLVILLILVYGESFKFLRWFLKKNNNQFNRKPNFYKLLSFFSIIFMKVGKLNFEKFLSECFNDI